jgi:hypothetical protein
MSVTREQQLAEAFVEAADTLVDDFDVIEFLHAAGVMLADSRGLLHAGAASTESARLVELFELQADAGPCVEAFRTGEQVVNVDLTASRDRWPRFAGQAQAAGFVAVHALPMRLRDVVIGALNLLSARPVALSEADTRTAQALADVATIGILAQRGLRQSELLAAQLQLALESRVAIEQAKGVLAERRQITVDEAFILLRGHAREHNLHLSDLARQVADGSSSAVDLLFAPGPPGAGVGGREPRAPRA